MRRALLRLLGIMAVACSRPHAPSPTPAQDASCVLLTRDSLTDTLTIGVPDPVDLTHAPVPTTEAERLVFGTFYQTLVYLDCHGRIEPGLAMHWTPGGDDGRHWRFALRNDARFWDGAPVTAEDVVAAWRDRGEIPEESLTALDDRTLELVLTRPDTAVPRWLADPRFAISRPRDAVTPPVGTGPYAITAWAPDRIEARPVSAHGPALRFRLGGRADPRDLLDQGADLVVTDDPEALRYAERREAFNLLPLPWAWTYVFVGESRVWFDDAVTIADLAGGAVHADVRAAEPPFWWNGASRCTEATASIRSPTPARLSTITYPASDPVARDIASRLVALAPLERLRSQGLGPQAFAEALVDSRTRGFVTALSRQGYASCLDLPAGVVVPLLDVRSWIVARRGRVGVVLDWDGTPRMVLP